MSIKLYFKYGSDIKSISDPNVIELVKEVRSIVANKRVRVIVENDNYESPTVQLAEYEFEFEEPWKSDYWLLNQTQWNGLFIPDTSWECVELT